MHVWKEDSAMTLCAYLGGDPRRRIICAWGTMPSGISRCWLQPMGSVELTWV